MRAGRGLRRRWTAHCPEWLSEEVRKSKKVLWVRLCSCDAMQNSTLEERRNFGVRHRLGVSSA